MKSIRLDDHLFQGAISLERTSLGVKPWRIPYEKIELFPPNGLGGRADFTAGVRLRFASNSDVIEVEVAAAAVERKVDLVIDGAIIQSVKLHINEQIVVFENLSRETKTIEIYLPQAGPVTIVGLRIADDASFEIIPDERLRWVTYGSSITQCSDAASPAETWPAIVARGQGLHLTSLGYGGNCHLEPMVARMIRDIPADFISLCLGINVYGSGSLNERTFRAMVIGFIETIREKHQDIPILVISPIYSPPREEIENKVGFTLVKMREEIQEALSALKHLGVEHLYYMDGLDLLGAEYESYLPDQLHPNAEGYRIMGERFQNWITEHSLLHKYN